MLHAAAMLIGLFALGLFALARSVSAETIAVAAGLAFASVVFAARFGGVGRTAFSAPQLAVLSLGRAGAVLRGALSTIRAAVAADVTLKPALVRVRTRPAGAFAQAAFADLMSAAPGVVVVEADAEGALVHVTDEDGVDAAEIGALEARVISALGGGQR
jgi:multisubunit Na+/H+ antiporter MnhE subunit